MVTENCSSDKVHVVVNGSLESSIAIDNGQFAKAEQYFAGDSFGWAAIVTDEKSIMTVRATSDSMVLAIDSDSLLPVLQEHEELRQKFSDLVNQRVNRFADIRSEKIEKRKSLSPSEIRHRVERFISHGSNRRGY